MVARFAWRERNVTRSATPPNLAQTLQRTVRVRVNVVVKERNALSVFATRRLTAAFALRAKAAGKTLALCVTPCLRLALRVHVRARRARFLEVAARNARVAGGGTGGAGAAVGTPARLLVVATADASWSVAAPCARRAHWAQLIGAHGGRIDNIAKDAG